ncbi:MAG: macro domain-containing protein [Oscillospiraceae bacterium]|nr:macro domain-containing protein [Oscillospiraceae bacterium]
MPFEILRNDIGNMQVDAIVNTAGVEPVIGSGTDAGIHAKAGPMLLEARKKIGRIRVGEAAITPGFQLPASYVIHAVAPAWQNGERGEEALLRKCYDRALTLARRKGCASVAFPLMAAGNLGFPKPLALQIAMEAFRAFLQKHEMQIYLVVFSKSVFQLSEQRVSHVASYIDETYVSEKLKLEYPVEESRADRAFQSRYQLYRPAPPRPMEADFCEGRAVPSPGPSEADFCEGRAVPAPREMPRPMAAPSMAPAPAPKKAAKRAEAGLFKAKKPAKSLEQQLRETDAGFSETLLKLIDLKGKKDSEVYNRANVSRQHFSKIRNNPDYRPTKPTALAFAIALELDLQQTRDLIGRAGYALTRSSKFDVILMYFIEQHNYDLFEINATLFQFDQSLLGA